MRKQISIIFSCLAVITTLSGCGMPGPLYQTPEKPPVENGEQPATKKSVQEKS